MIRFASLSLVFVLESIFTDASMSRPVLLFDRQYVTPFAISPTPGSLLTSRRARHSLKHIVLLFITCGSWVTYRMLRLLPTRFRVIVQLSGRRYQAGNSSSLATASQRRDVIHEGIRRHISVRSVSFSWRRRRWSARHLCRRFSAVHTT